MPNLDVLDKPKIYVDYESNTQNLFYVLGYRWNEENRQIILTNSLKGLAEKRNLDVSTPARATEFILDLALQNDASIVAFSEAERDYFNYLNKNDCFKKYSSSNSVGNLLFLYLANASAS